MTNLSLSVRAISACTDRLQCNTCLRVGVAPEPTSILQLHAHQPSQLAHRPVKVAVSERYRRRPPVCLSTAVTPLVFTVTSQHSWSYQMVCRRPVWCDHCDAWHWHGPLAGQRVAHCYDPASPYEARRYNIWLVGGGRGRGLRRRGRRDEGAAGVTLVTKFTTNGGRRL